MTVKEQFEGSLAIEPVKTMQIITPNSNRFQEQNFAQDKIDLIKRTIAVGATNDELELFLYTAKKTGLDPLARQIYAIKRGGKMTIQTGIDGYRLIADRTRQLAGISDYVFDSEDGKNPKKATVTVSKIIDGLVRDFTASARWEEYSQPSSPMWQKMPYLMLGKCAEALALRKAFPADLSGLYTAEEMSQADVPGVSESIAPQGTQRAQKTVPQVNPDAEDTNDYDVHAQNGDLDGYEVKEPMYPRDKPAPPVARKQGPVISEAQSKRFFAICMGNGKSKPEVSHYLASKGYAASTDILRYEYEELCAWAGAK